MYGNQASTNFSYDENVRASGTGIIQNKALSVAGLGFLLLLETGSTQFFRAPDEKETIFTVSELRQEWAYSLSTKDFIISSSQQLAEIKQNMGFNIIEMAAILHVSRPTIYDWFVSTNTIRNNNQTRIDVLYEVCKKWKSKGLHRLGSFLHKKIGENNMSLFDLLKNEVLNQKEIGRYIDTIAQAILQKKQDDEAYEDLLKKHYFEPVDKKDMDNRLNDIHFLD